MARTAIRRMCAHVTVSPDRDAQLAAGARADGAPGPPAARCRASGSLMRRIVAVGQREQEGRRRVSASARSSTRPRLRLARSAVGQMPARAAAELGQLGRDLSVALARA